MTDREEICRKAQSFFDDLWRRGDPWELETSNWEHERYARLLAVLDKVHEGCSRRGLITGILGIPAKPTVIEVVGWLLYAVPMLLILLAPDAVRPRMRATVAGAAVVAAPIVLIAGVAAVATIGALVVQLRNYESFLLLLGSCFVPLFGVLLADWLASGARYTTAQIFGAPAWRTELLAAWLLGFLLYHWLHEPPLGPSWWVDIVEETGQPNLGIGASLPSFAASFVLALVFGSLGSRLPEPASKW